MSAVDRAYEVLRIYLPTDKSDEWVRALAEELAPAVVEAHRDELVVRFDSQHTPTRERLPQRPPPEGLEAMGGGLRSAGIGRVAELREQHTLEQRLDRRPD